MACPSCGTTVLFGGVKEGKKRYCSKQCHADDAVYRLADTMPADQVDALAAEIHGGDCPKCGGLLVAENKQSASCTQCGERFPLEQVTSEPVTEAA
jgi:DNA-directed RNA polymerase subunit M/transcription elongation factor TFIIS